MKKMLARLSRLAANDRGTAAIEYAFVASLISAMIVSGATMMGTEVSGFLTSVTSGL